MTRPSFLLFYRARHHAAILLYLAGLSLPSWAQFETRASYSFPGESLSVAVGDFNRDGKLDAAVASSGSIVIMLGNGDGTFRQGASYPGRGFYWIAAADFNSDGFLDLVVSVATDTSTVEVFLGNGDGTFQAPKASPTTEMVSSLAVGDFNGDKKMDLAVADGQYVSVLLGNGDGTFQSPIDNTSFVGPHQVAVADFNNDHNLDVSVVGYFGGSQNLGVLLGNGNGTLQPALIYPLNYVPDSVAVGDFNGDGVADVAIGGYISYELMVLLGNGDGSFGQETDYSGGGSVAILGDFSGNGKLDIVAEGAGFGAAEFRGNGDGTFQAVEMYSSNAGAPFAAGDLNGDHLPDLVLLDNLHATVVTSMLSTGALSFSPSSPLSFPTQLIGTKSKAKSVKLTNQGGSIIPITSIRSAAPFQITSTCGTELAIGASCMVTATFAPTKPGTQSAVVKLVDSASSKPQFIELAGAATAVETSPSSLNFGSEKVGTKSAPQAVTVTNRGDAPVTFGAISINGTDPLDFSETDNCSGQKVSPGGSCEAHATFVPTHTGARSAKLNIPCQGTVSPQPVSLSGTGD